MRNLMKTTGVVMLLVGGLCVTHAATVDREVALNTFWSEVSRTVAEGDFAGYFEYDFEVSGQV